MTGPGTGTGTATGTGAGVQAPPEAPSLSRKVGSAARWSLVNTVVMRLGNFVTGIVLARFFLGPEAWGVYGIAQTVLLVLLSANELGVSLAIVRWEGDPRRFAPTVLTLSVSSSLLLYAVLFTAAPAVARVLGSPEASGILRVMCVCVVLDGLSQVPAGFLTREFAQGRRMAIDAVNFVLSTSVTLLLAVEGRGAMSFAWGSVAGNAAALAGCCLAAPGTLRFGWDREQARALLQFGLPSPGPACWPSASSTWTRWWWAPPSTSWPSASTCSPSTSPAGPCGSSPRRPAGSRSPGSPGWPTRRGHWPAGSGAPWAW